MRLLPAAITVGRAVVTARWTVVTARWTVVTTGRAVINRRWPVVDRLLHIDRRWLVINRWRLLYVNRLWLGVDRLLYVDRPVAVDDGRADDCRTNDRAKYRWTLPTVTAASLCLPCHSKSTEQQGN